MRLAWQPISLVTGPLRITEIQSSRVALKRLPETLPKKNEKPLSIFSGLRALPAIVVEELAVNQIHLGEPVFGKPADFSLKGALQDGGQDRNLKGELTLKRVDTPQTLLDLRFTLQGRKPVLDLALEIEAPEEVWLQLLPGVKGRGPLKAALHGHGPLAAWPGRLSIELQSLGTLQADTVFTAEEMLSLKADGNLRFAEHVMAPSLLKLFPGRTADVQFFADLGSIEKPFPQRLQLTTSCARVQVALEPHEVKAFEGRFSISFSDLSLLQDVIEQKTAGSLNLAGDFSGPLDQPRTDLALTLADLHCGPYTAADLRLDLSFKALEKSFWTRPHMAAEIAGRIQGFRGGTGCPVFASDPFEWQVSAVVTKPLKNIWRIDRCVLKAADSRLSFVGRIDPASALVTGKLSAHIAQPAALAFARRPGLEGRLHLEADLQANLRTPFLQADLRGAVEGIKGLPSRQAPLLASKTTGQARVRFGSDQKLVLSGLDIRTDGAGLSGNAAVHLSTRETSGAFDLHLSRLALMRIIPEFELDGTLDLNARVSGRIFDPDVQIRARSDRLAVQGQVVEQIEVAVNATDFGSTPGGDFRVNGSMRDTDLASKGEFFVDNGLLALSNLVLQAGAAEVQGQLKVALAEPAVTGTLQSRNIGLSEIAPLLQISLDGRAGISAEFQKTQTGQTVTVDLTAEKVGSPWGGAASLSAEARIENLFKDSTFQMTARARHFKRDGLNLTNLLLQAEGNMRRGSFQLSTDGLLDGGSLTLSTRGAVETGEKYLRLQIRDLSGSYRNMEFRFENALVFSRNGPEYVFQPLKCIFGEAVLSMEGLLTPREVNARIDVTSFPLKYLKVTGLPELAGSLDAKLRLVGFPRQPQAQFSLIVEQMRFAAGMMPPDSVPFRAELSGTYAAGRLHALFQASGLADSNLSAEVQAPVTIQLDPSDFQFSPAGSLDGKLSALVNFKPLAALVILENQHLSGRLTADLAFEGAWRTPEVNGIVKLENGRYEHPEHGLILEKMQISARMNENRITIEKAGATDGESGRITLDGWLILDREKRFPLSMNLHMKDCTVIRRPDLTAAFNGDLDLSGNFRDLDLTGQLIVSPADYRLPRVLRTDIPELNVQEIHLPPSQKSAAQVKNRSGSPRLNLDIALNSPGQVFVRGSGLFSEWKGNLRVSGSSGNPALTGQLAVVRGNYRFYDIQFELTEGVILFSGARPPSPNFRFTGVEKRSDLTASITVSGTPESVSLDLFSEPALPKDEILARLLFGRSMAELTPLQALRLAAAVGALAGKSGPAVMDFLQNTHKLIGVDELSVAPDQEGQTEVRIGKYLGEDLFVELKKGFGAEGSGEVLSVEMQITPNLSLESEAGIDGQGGAILNWIWNF